MPHLLNASIIIFVFTYLEILQVMSKGSNSGPKGVTISLYKETKKGSSPVSSTITSQDGSFYFTPIQPGNYIVNASHPQ